MFSYFFREPTNIVVVADVDLCDEHNEVMDKFFSYLKENGGVEKVFYVKDPDEGPNSSESIQSWWQRALRDPKVVKDGCLIVVAGPTAKKVRIKSKKIYPKWRSWKNSSDSSDYPNLMNIQMAELSQDPFEEREVVQPGNIQLNMHTCMNQRRLAVLKFPYSDIRTLPIQV